MCHWWSLTDVSWRLCEISATVMQPFTSCLLAKISSPAFLKSWRAEARKYATVTSFVIPLCWFETTFLPVYFHSFNTCTCADARAFSVSFTATPASFHHTYFMHEHFIQFLLGDGDPFSVCTVHHHNDKLQRRRKYEWTSSRASILNGLNQQSTGLKLSLYTQICTKTSTQWI